MAPRKVRAIAGLVRGLSVNEAEAQLMYQRKRASKPMLKLLRSAVANAKQNKLDPDKMVIGRLTVDQGPMLKRALPRARGSASPIQKKMSHVTLVLTEVEKPKEKRFNIVAPKKAKLSKEMPTPKRKKKAETKGEETGRSRKTEQDPGFFQKVFRRKSI